jgi:heme-degrading monooxygenase HmoA
MRPRKRGIARVWQGRTTDANAHAYQEHLRDETLPLLQAIAGFDGAFVLRRVDDDDVEFLVLTLWSSQDAIHAFAGRDAERAVVPPAAAHVLKQWDDRALHYEVALTAQPLDQRHDDRGGRGSAGEVER